MGDADLLRRAATAMRERANGFITEDSTPPRVDIDKEGTCDGCAQYLHLVASYPDGNSEPWLCAPCAAYVDHQAAWTQPLALAVADWLDVHASDLAMADGNFSACDSPADTRQAVAVARAYLQESP